MIIAIDFDGTCVTHDYPAIGKDIGAIRVLWQWLRNARKPRDTIACITGAISEAY